jgi:predicted O-methyltransferase YrrM
MNVSHLVWGWKKKVHALAFNVSNALFGPELTHRSRLAKFLLLSWTTALAYLSPAQWKQRAFERRYPDAPWLVPSSIEYLDQLLQPSFRAFEWGSGRSTIWIAKRSHFLMSVEGRKVWYQEMLNRIEDEGLMGKVRIYLAEVTTEFAFQPDEIERYAGVIDAVSDASLDFVLVDGHFRTACLRRCLRKIRLDGILVIDNFDTREFDRCRRLSTMPGARVFTNGISETAVFQVDASQKAQWEACLA